jgi:hypothetical protein
LTPGVWDVQDGKVAPEAYWGMGDLTSVIEVNCEDCGLSWRGSRKKAPRWIGRLVRQIEED